MQLSGRELFETGAQTHRGLTDERLRELDRCRSVGVDLSLAFIENAVGRAAGARGLARGAGDEPVDRLAA